MIGYSWSKDCSRTQVYGLRTGLPPRSSSKISFMGRGITIMHIYSGQLKYLWLPLPPLPEQRTIVRYLDHVDRRIRQYVTAKRKLIALLEEEKQAIVNQAVTRGLDPNVRLKPSGIQWLGDVPEHWERRRLKTVLRPIDRRSTSGSETLLSLRRDHGVVVYAEHFKRPSQSRSLVGFKLVRRGAACGQSPASQQYGSIQLGRVCSTPLYDGLVSPDYSVFEGRCPIDMKFLSDLLRTSSYRAYFRQNATGLGTGTAGFLRLYDDTLLETPVYLPHVGEQSATVEHIDKAIGDRDAGIARARRQIELVEEYRTRLIADGGDWQAGRARGGGTTAGRDRRIRVRLRKAIRWRMDMDEEIYDAEEEPAIAEEVRI